MKFWEETEHVRGKQMEDGRAQNIKDREQIREEKTWSLSQHFILHRRKVPEATCYSCCREYGIESKLGGDIITIESS